MGLFDRIRGGGDEPRVAFFGIDGVPYSLIDDNRKEFPNLARLIDEGSAGPIDSIVPPESSACWPALTSGVNPGETGVYGFQDREVGSYDTYVPMRRDVQTKRVWDRVHEAGREATVMNVVTTFPPQRDVQRMVSGFLSPQVDKAAYPDELRDTLQRLDYRIDTNAGLGHRDKGEFMDDAHETIDARHEAFKHYIEEDDWDLFFGVYMTTDRVNHFLFRDYEEDGEYADEFVEFYRKVDEYLGELREMLPEDVTMMVASDHGFTSLDYEVNCNAWLRENGWLSYEQDDDYVFQVASWLREGDRLEYDPSFAGDLDELVDPADLAAALEDGRLVADTEGERDEAVAALEDATPAVVDDGDDQAAVVGIETIDTDETDDEYHVTADLVRAEGDAYVQDDTVVALTDEARDHVVEGLEDATPKSLGLDKADTTELLDDVTVEDTEDGFRITLTAADGVELGDDLDPETDVLEYTHTELPDIADEADVYSLIPGRFYINLDGREPRGSVPQEEYEEVRAELKSELEELTGPNGEPVAERVVTTEDAFRGDHDDIAPDLVIVPNHGFDLKAGFKGRKNPFVEFAARNGMHSFDNASLFVDDEDARISDVDLYDIAPTILDLMDVDYERGEFDGSSLV